MTPKKKEHCYFKVTYKDAVENKIETLKARKIVDSSLGLSFICISEFIFDIKGIVVDPAEEALSKKFANIKNIHLSIYSIIAIEEVGEDHDGLRFKTDRSNLVMLNNKDLPN